MSGQPAIRDRLALALDVADRDAALELVERFGADFGVMKIGLELFVAEGPSIVRDVVAAGCKVFLDLKLHDIPNTVHQAARRAGALGVWLLTLHAAGGAEMLTAGVRGLTEGAEESPRDTTPIALGVTVLTSDASASASTLTERAALAQRSGCGGLVCAAPDLAALASICGDMLRVVPGIRPAGAPRGDQSRVADPLAALAAGADVLVIGRAVTAAADPTAAAAAIVGDVTTGLAASSLQP